MLHTCILAFESLLFYILKVDFSFYRVLLGNKIKFIPDGLFNLPNLERM